MSDDDLRDLLGDAVADVEPRDRLGEIRRRTARPARHRRWPLVVLGAGTATAAVVSAVAVLGGLGVSQEDGGPSTRPPRVERATVATYYSQVTSGRLYLFREFRSVDVTDDPAALVLRALRLLEDDAGAEDPDYETQWPDGSFLDVTIEDDVVRVEVSAEAQQEPEVPRNATVLALPAVQQAVYTVQAAVGALLPISFESGGTPVNRILWTPVANPVRRDPALAAPVNISDPAEGHTVDDLLTVRGTIAPSSEARSVRWRLLAEDYAVMVGGDAPVTSGSWEQTEDIAEVPPGTYRLIVLDPGDDAPVRDTRTVVVR